MLNNEELTFKNVKANKENVSLSGSTFSKRISIEEINIKSLLSGLNSDCYFYFKNKDSSLELLFIDSLKDFKSLEEITILEKLLAENRDLFIPGSYFFDNIDDQYGHFFLPKYVLGKINETFVLIENSLTDDITESPCLSKIIKQYREKAPQKSDSFDLLKTTETPAKEEWDKMVNNALYSISESDLSKIVLHRKYRGQFANIINPADYFLRNVQKNNHSYEVLFKYNPKTTFISYSPETLYRISENNIAIDSIAGTRPRSEAESEDKLLADELLKDPKELSEHRFVTDYIIDNLNSIDISAKITKKEEILKLKHVQHIHSQITANITNESKLKILQTLHPTPAVAGTPKGESKKLIKEIEKETRTFYASALGFMNKEISEMSVGIRSCLISNNTIEVYGGCGIVQGSEPTKEWNETKQKMKNFINKDNA